MNANTSPTVPAGATDLSFTLPLSALRRALDNVALAIPEGPPAVPAARGVLIEASEDTVTFSATTIFRTVSVCLPAASPTPGHVVVDYVALTEMLRSFVGECGSPIPESVSVAFRGPELSIGTAVITDTCAPVVADGQVPVFSVGEYPTLTTAPPAQVEMDREAFLTSLARVMGSVEDMALATESLKLDLCADGVTLAVSDENQRRIAVARVPAHPVTGEDALPRANGPLLTETLVNELINDFFTGDTIRLGIDERTRTVSLASDTVTVVAPGIPELFTSYRDVAFADAAVTITVDSEHLLTDAHRSACAQRMAGGSANAGVALLLGPSTVSVAPVLDGQPDLATQTPPRPADVMVNHSGFIGGFAVIVHPVHLANAVRAMPGDTVALHHMIPRSGCCALVVTGTAADLADPHAFRVVLPVR
jgi:hypothetical protein